MKWNKALPWQSRMKYEYYGVTSKGDLLLGQIYKFRRPPGDLHNCDIELDVDIIGRHDVIFALAEDLRDIYDEASLRSLFAKHKQPLPDGDIYEAALTLIKSVAIQAKVTKVLAHTRTKEGDYIMAKKKTEAEAAPAAEKKEVIGQPKNENIKLVRDLHENEKVAPQAMGIINCVREFGGECTREQLMNRLGEFVQTKQPPARIFQFYRKKLEEQGILKYTPIAA